MPKKKNAVRKDGRIKVEVYIGRDENGKRKYKYAYGKTQKEADAQAEKIKISLRKGLDVMAERDTFEEWANRFLYIKSNEVTESWAAEYKSIVGHINLYIGDAEINKIKTVHLQEVIYNLAKKNPNTGKPASKRFLDAVKTTMTQIFRLAIENRVLDYNPAQAIKIPKTNSSSERRALTDEEQKWINETGHRAKSAAMIMMYAGLRRGELVPLTWNDIDLKNQTISVNKTVRKSGNEFVTQTTAKTNTSIRIIDLPQHLVDYLKTQKREGIYVCLNSSGNMHTPSSWKKLWDSYLMDLNVKYGDFSAYQRINSRGEVRTIKSKHDPDGVPFVIPRITPHWLRHTFATMLYLSGVDVLTAKEQLGHADIKTTLGIYTHLDAKHKRKSMDKLDEYLKNMK